ncbi:hypothetical protein [Kitasatospora sp. NPDC094015]|uniref:hypothetical protein n=1 Tax=Kitasatospora sp. NPDC094015 TaxID=3155205 RepID=UPI00332F4C4C
MTEVRIPAPATEQPPATPPATAPVEDGRWRAARRAAAVLLGARRRRPVPVGRPIQESDHR